MKNVLVAAVLLVAGAGSLVLYAALRGGVGAGGGTAPAESPAAPGAESGDAALRAPEPRRDPVEVEPAGAEPEVDVERAVVESDAPRVVGRVVDGVTGAGIPGVRVEAQRVRRVESFGVTDAGGRFELAAPEGLRPRLVAIAPERWLDGNERVALSEPQRAGREPVVLTLWPARRGPLAIEVRDENTGELVPDLELVVKVPGEESITLVTDDRGRAVSERELLLGNYVYESDELPGERDPFIQLEPPAVLVHSAGGAGAPDALEVGVGPTYSVRVDGYAGDPEALAGWLGWTGDARGDRPLVSLPTWSASRAEPLRAGEPPWVRFRADAVWDEVTGPWTLAILDEERSRMGTVHVDSIEGRYDRVLDVELRPFGELALTVESTDGIAPGDLEVELVPRDSGVTPLVLRPSPGGGFSERILPTGEYVARALTDYGSAEDVAFEVHAGERADVTVHLAPIAGLGSVIGRMELAPGTEVSAYVQLREPDELDSSFGDSPDPFEGNFRIAGIPPGRYRIDVYEDEIRAWTPSEIEVVPGENELVLRLDPSVAVADLGFHLTDAVTGDEVERFQLGVAGKFNYFDEVERSGRPVLRAYPLSRELRWFLQADGYAPVEGDESAFDEVEHRGTRERRWARLALQPGWGAWFEFQADGEPVPNATLHLDGEVVGVSDAEGRLYVARETPPSRGSVDHPELVVAGGAIDPATGEIPAADAMWYRVELRPAGD